MSETLKQNLGAASGGAIGATSSVAAISSAGAVSGLGAAGITSGLAAVGSVIGGGMLAGLCIAVALPVAGCVAGVAIMRAAGD